MMVFILSCFTTDVDLAARRYEWATDAVVTQQLCNADEWLRYVRQEQQYDLTRADEWCLAEQRIVVARACWEQLHYCIHPDWCLWLESSDIYERSRNRWETLRRCVGDEMYASGAIYGIPKR